MPTLTRIAIALLAAAAAACDATTAAPAAVQTGTPASVESSATAPSPSTGDNTDAAVLPPQLKKGMAYADLRTAVLAAGWLPLASADCRENVGGEAAICGELPELDACSGDGRCTMNFAHAGSSSAMLRVDTSGDYLQWRATGAQAALTVDAFSVKDAPSASRAASCPAQDFPRFLQAFATDKSIRDAFTLPLVKVSRMDVGSDVAPQDTYERAADYRGFIVQHRNDGYYVVPEVGAPVRTELDIRADGAAAYLVSYRFGSSEGNSFRFERRDACWYLAADPEPPAS